MKLLAVPGVGGAQESGSEGVRAGVGIGLAVAGVVGVIGRGADALREVKKRVDVLVGGGSGKLESEVGDDEVGEGDLRIEENEDERKDREREGLVGVDGFMV